MWFDNTVVKQDATLREAATDYYSRKRKYKPAAESHLLYNGGLVFDVVAKYMRGQLDPNIVEQEVGNHFLQLLSMGRTRVCFEALSAVVFDPELENHEEATQFYIDLATTPTADQEKIFTAWFWKFVEGRSNDSWTSLYDLLGADVEGTLHCGETTRRGLLHFGDPGRAYAWVLVD